MAVRALSGCNASVSPALSNRAREGGSNTWPRSVTRTQSADSWTRRRDSPKPSANLRMHSADRRKPSVDCRMPSAKRRKPHANRWKPSADCGKPSADRWKVSADCWTPSADWRTPSADRRRSSANRRMPSAGRGKRSTDRGKPSANHVMSSGYRRRAFSATAPPRHRARTRRGRECCLAMGCFFG